MVWGAVCAVAGRAVEAAVDWEGFMEGQDMVWDRLPGEWSGAPFTGNGTLGVYATADRGDNALRFEVGNSLAHDHRESDKSVYGRGRLLVGTFVARLKGRILSDSCRLDFWNAEARFKVVTSEGAIVLRQYTASGSPYIIMEAECSGGEAVDWVFVPAKADSPRQLKASRKPGHAHFKKNYISNPEPEVTADADGGLCRQRLLEGGETATAWKIFRGDGGRSAVVATIEHSFPGNGAAEGARGNIADVTPGALAGIEVRHRGWWHAFYPASFVSLPDKRVENFYWAQIYKLGSATHPEGCLIDNCGPWLTETPWPNAWWNLNVQLAYWPLLASNHLDLNGPLIRVVADNMDNLAKNVPAEYRHDSAGIPVATDFTLEGGVKVPGMRGNPQIGCLPWLCHNLWLHYRHSMDEEFLRDTLYPVLRRAVNLYLHFLGEGDDGRLHLAASYSPEYGTAEDCNFDLALLRWGCSTLIEASEVLGIDDPLRERWEDVGRRLAPYAENADGMMIGRDMAYEKSHRHYSHLLMFYPLYLLNAETPGAYELMDRSARHWHSIPGNIFAYSYTGASSMYAAFGEGDEALRHLRSALAQKNLCSNTMYRESGPVIETPLSAAKCVQDMLLQSWGGKLRVFPAVPSEWGDASFADFRAEGAFLVSARREGGATVSLTVESLAGEPCVVVTDMENPAVAAGSGTLAPLGKGEYALTLGKGESVTLTPSGRPAAPISEVPGPGRNHYGSAKR
ncbi:MAG: alpha-L-fucosidase [Alistipes timonensis]|nr:alpha-L-fucosidase [Alistipes timonensis]